MSKLDELLRELCPNGVEYKQLGEIATDIYRGSGIKLDQITDEGIPCVRYGEIYTTYNIWFDECLSHTKIENVSSPKWFEHGDILFVITGESVEDIAKSVAYVGKEKCLAGGDIVVMKHTQNPKYLAYALSASDARQQKSKGRVKSKVVHSNVPAIKNIKIPIPPIEVQNEIVRILDMYTTFKTELNSELEKEVIARKKQYEYYRDRLLTFDNPIGGARSDVQWVALGDLGKVSMCKRIMKAETSSEGDVPFYKIGTFGGEANAYISYETFERYKNAYSYPKVGDVLISAAGTIGRTVVFDGKPAYFQDSNIVWIDNDESKVLNSFLRYYYQTQPWKVSSGGTIARLYNDNISSAKVPVLPKETQRRLVHVLDDFDAICSDLNIGLPAEIEARQKQYEYYRDMLLTFDCSQFVNVERERERERDGRNAGRQEGLIKLFQYVYGVAYVRLSDIAVYSKERISSEDVNEQSYVGVDNLLPDKQGKFESSHVPAENNCIKYMSGDVLIGNIRPYLKKIWLADRVGGTNGDVLVVSPTSSCVLPQFLYYVLSSDEFFAYDMQHSKGAKMPRGSKEAVMNYSFRLPSLKEQKRIVSILDRFNTLCNDLSSGLPAEINARQKQYEYYRDKLLTFEHA